MSLDPLSVFTVVGICGIIAFVLGRHSRQSDVNAAENREKGRFQQYLDSQHALKELGASFNGLKKTASERENHLVELQQFVDATLRDWQRQSAILPSLRYWADSVRHEYDRLLEKNLRVRPALRAADEVKQAKAESRQYRKELEAIRAQLSLYDSLAPWLSEYTQLTVDEILEGINEEREFRELYNSGDDPVRLFVPEAEWSRLTVIERNQLALDRYWNGSRRRTAWSAGIQYERFIGYKYEREGYRVQYQGALLGVDDLGIDLICTKGDDTHIVQCKRLSPIKGLPVRENVIAQTYGASVFHTMEHSHCGTATPVLYTTYEASEIARRFASQLGVRLHEHIQFEPYPCIKCNISQIDNQRIYHLPFDQQYDSTVIGDHKNEFYAMTVKEAEDAGFRRAYRWKGNSK